MLSADFFQNQLFRKILSGIPSECQADWIQTRPNILSGLIWVQTVCKNYQQTTLGDNELGHIWYITDCRSDRVLDWRPRGSRFEPHGRHCLVSLNKTH